MTTNIFTNNTQMVKGFVVGDSSQDPAGLGRYQVYIPSYHGDYEASKVGSAPQDVTGNPADKDIKTSVNKYPWASYLVLGGDLSQVPTTGSVVLIGIEGNDPNSLVILGTIGNIASNMGSSFLDIGLLGGSLAKIAAEIIFGNEGNYESVNWDDNGAISIGKIQWHANRARNLLRKIRDKNSTKFDFTCTTSFAFDLSGLVTGDHDWSGMKYWNADCPQGKAIKTILATDESHKAQDEQAIEDVQGYIDDIQKCGVTDPGCIIYLADIWNQYGSAYDLAKAGINNLDQLYAYSLNHGYGAYASRRKSTYSKIKEKSTQLITAGLPGMAGDTGNGVVGWPAPGISSITSEYGPRWGSFHTGIDIGAPEGTTIVSPITGTVISTAQYGDSGKYDNIADGVGGYGYYQIVIASQPINGVWYGVLMAHQKCLGSINSMVNRGTAIGISGNTGNSTGAHIHFEVRILSSGDVSTSNFFAGTHKNPLDYVNRP